MVAWTPGTDGTLSGYDGTTHQWKRAFFHFASPGSVNINGITRLGVALDSSFSPASYPNVLVADAKMTLSSGDISTHTITSQRRFGMVMYLVPANVIPAQPGGADPKPTVIRNYAIASGIAIRSTTVATTAGDHDFFIKGIRLAQGVRYWVALIPAIFVVNDLNNYLLGHGVDNDVLGRALSVWGNRSPVAPTITSPAQNTVKNPGETFTLTIDTNDPDAVTPDDTPRMNRDMAGVEFQYAAQATPDNPNPTWEPFTFISVGSTNERSWSLIGQDVSGNDFSYLRTSLGADVKCGDFGDSESGKGWLPPGKWQIRSRVFDFGHPYPMVAEPGNGRVSGTGYGLSPNTYPAQNTSPWSTPVKVSVAAQVPAPIPLSPKDNRAVQIDSPVRLIWQYRNSHTPPYPQYSATIQIRKVGDTTWHTNGISGTQNYMDIGDGVGDMFVFEVGTRYEWRVNVFDDDPGGPNPSGFSEIARFWVVDAPSSGPGRPGNEDIEGATLGCGTHKAEIYRRGGKIKVGEITNLSYVDWERKRDEISTAKIVVSDWDLDCGNMLAKLQTWAYEIVIWRDNGYSQHRVWEGPITLLTYEKDAVTIHAKDVMGYAYRRIMKQEMKESGTASVVDRARRVLQNAYAPDDPNVLGYLQVLTNDNDALAYRNTPAYSRMAYEEVDDMAANAGLDYTVLGRSIILWGTKNRIGTLPEFKDDDLGAVPIVSEYGMSMANRYAKTNGQGVHGEAVRGGLVKESDDFIDPIYGLVEMLSSTFSDDDEPITGTYNQDDLNKLRQSYEEATERSIADRYPPPMIVRIPDNTTINPKAVVSIQHLVPGVVVPLRSSGTLRKVSGNQKLDSVKVVEQNGKEIITITLSSFGHEDLDAETGGDDG